MFSPIAEINLQNLLSNTKYIKSIIGEKQLFPVVKANAYGHGLVQIVKFLNKLNIVDGFCVATPFEAESILSLNINKPIFILGKFDFDKIDLLKNKNLIPTIHSIDDFEMILSHQNQNINTKIQIKIDTGMGRMGFELNEIPFLIKEIIKHKINIIGVWSHLSSANEPNSNYTNIQIEKFKSILSLFLNNGVNPKYKHIANSSGILFHPKSYFNAVRPGISLYGISPDNEINHNLKPVMKFKIPLIKMKLVDKNYSIGYNNSYITSTSEEIGIFQGGYADGIPTIFNNNGNLEINGKLLPIRGKISMDMFVCDISNQKLKLGDYATLWGSESLKLEDLSKIYNKISYEFLVNLSDRVERVYL
jgi:alanine racemase